jgi:hypothetical protein
MVTTIDKRAYDDAYARRMRAALHAAIVEFTGGGKAIRTHETTSALLDLAALHIAMIPPHARPSADALVAELQRRIAEHEVSPALQRYLAGGNA